MSNAKAKQKLQGATFENEMQVVEAAQISQRAKFDIACLANLVDHYALSDADASGRIERAVLRLNMSAQHMVAAGVDLLILRESTAHGKFMQLLDERGLGKDCVYRAMNFAQFVANQPVDRQNAFIELGQSKVLALAKADPLVLEQMLEDGDGDLQDLSVRDLRQRIRALEADKVNALTDLETAETVRDKALKDLSKATKGRDSGKKPFIVEDIQQETAIYLKASELALDGLQTQMADAATLVDGAAASWAGAVQGTVFAAIVSAHAKTSSLLQQTIDGGFAPDSYAEIAASAALSDEGLSKVVERSAELFRHADYEKRLRIWEREQERPRSKGRPMAKPELNDE